MSETSRIAKAKFDASEKKLVHHKIISKALRACQFPLTGFGIAQRTELTYHQVMRRMKELEEDDKVIQHQKKIDVDGSNRMSYKII